MMHSNLRQVLYEYFLIKFLYYSFEVGTIIFVLQMNECKLIFPNHKGAKLEVSIWVLVFLIPKFILLEFGNLYLHCAVPNAD